MEAILDSNTVVQEQTSQKELFRLSAMIYADMTSDFSSQDVLLGIIECALLECDNQQCTVAEIQSFVLQKFKMNIADDEIFGIVKRNKELFLEIKGETDPYYQLTPNRFEAAKENIEKNIDYYINLFIESEQLGAEQNAREAIYKYLYELTTTNINSYKLMFSAIASSTKFKDIDLSVDSSQFDDSELIIIHDFVAWDNDEKNIALSNIVFTCLEYCLLVSGDSANSILSKLTKDCAVFLDTNIIFRALGINGKARKTVIDAFLNKCKQANITMAISTFTKTEFFNAIDYYIEQIRQFPRGEIYLGAYESLSDYNMYAFYNEWLQDHTSLSLKYFRKTIESSYDLFIKTYDIKNTLGEKVNIFSSDATVIRKKYETAISGVKRSLKDRYIDPCKPDILSGHDATLVYLTESKRRLDKKNGKTTENFLVSSDKALRFWDMSRTKKTAPIVIYPSQLFLMLIRVCGRSEDDVNSFVSFINVRSRSQHISPEKANIILSGISSITADIETQKIIVSNIFEDDFQKIIRNSNTDRELYENTKLYSERYLEDELTNAETARDNAVAQVDRINQELEGTGKKLVDATNELEKQKERICQFAEEKTIPKFIFIYYICPAIIFLCTIAYVAFVTLQFVACKEPWNMVTKISAFIHETTFGKGSSGPLYLIDAAFFGVLYKFWKLCMKNPFNKELRNMYQQNFIEQYIKENNL